ncbi:GNAT family N-acetyltransferase [Salipaludibacillus daqingensis]|uniref:GNAT family N-acetyltransferase n=1 Tax=Salipaludibacillus daqingensis TaxID=3041001 RepID=UPI0024738B6B|nr:GNAT family N-acetyltransferase [Salipaludibacillus daqingensis]
MEVKVAGTNQEKKDVYSVRRQVFIIEQRVPEDIEVDDKEEQSIHFIAYEEKTPVGAGRIRIDGSSAKAERVCVLADKRGKGIGAKIMVAMEHYSRENRLLSLKLNAQIQAEEFYKRLGYETVSDTFYDANILHVTMNKNF